MRIFTKNCTVVEPSRYRAVLLAASALLSASSSSQVLPAKANPSIQAINAQLFFTETGKFSANLFGQSEKELWNTIIGEGAAGSPSHSTFLTIELGGKKASNLHTTHVLSVVTQEQGKKPMRHRFSISEFSEDGKHFEGIWLADVGCLPITITARLDNQEPIRKTIDFKCGE